MSNSIINFDYKGSQISFNKGEKVMINATEMAKPFGKRPAKWLELPSTKEFLAALTEVRKSDFALIQTDKGGINGGGGTWMHEDVALEFARWLSPAFAIWCNDRIKELMTTGVTTISNDDEAIAYAMQVLNKRLEQAKADNARLEAENKANIETIRQQAPKVSYYDNCLQSVNTLTTTQIAKQIGMDAEKLHRKLKEAGILFRQSGQWMLRSPYSAWGLHATRTQTYTRSDGSTGTSTYTVWTEKGRRFIIALHRNGYSTRQAVREIRGEQKR